MARRRWTGPADRPPEIKRESRWRRLARRLFKAYCATAALATLVLCWAVTGNPERHASTALLQYFPYVIYLAPALLAVVVSLWLGSRWRALALVTLGLVLTVPMGLAVGRADEGRGHLRLMSYNAKVMYAVHRRNGMGELAKEIIDNDPDVLLMQDAGNMVTVRNRNPKLFKTIVGDRQVYTVGQYLVASRLPFKNCKTPYIQYEDQPHTYLHCVLEAHGKEVELINVHLLTPRMGLNAVRHEGMDGLDEWRRNMLNRLEQARHLSADLGRLSTRPRIVAGDLNAPERSAVVQMLLDTGLRDAWSSASFGYGFTYGHALRLGFPFLRIDHVLVSDDIGVVSARVGGHEASEHSPVIVDLRMHRD